MNHYEILIACVCLTIYVVGVDSLKLIFSGGMPKLWQRGVGFMVIGLAIALVLRFVPDWAKYSTLVGLIGVAVKETLLGAVRWREAANKHLPRGYDRNQWVVAVGVVVIIMCVAGVWAVNNSRRQDAIEGKVNHNQDLTRETIERMERLEAKLDRDYAQRQNYFFKDSVYKVGVSKFILDEVAQDKAENKDKETIKRNLKSWNRHQSKIRSIPQLAPLKTTSMVVQDLIDPGRVQVQPYLVMPKGKKKH